MSRCEIPQASLQTGAASWIGRAPPPEMCPPIEVVAWPAGAEGDPDAARIVDSWPQEGAALVTRQAPLPGRWWHADFECVGGENVVSESCFAYESRTGPDVD